MLDFWASAELLFHFWAWIKHLQCLVDPLLDSRHTEAQCEYISAVVLTKMTPSTLDPDPSVAMHHLFSTAPTPAINHVHLQEFDTNWWHIMKPYETHVFHDAQRAFNIVEAVVSPTAHNLKYQNSITIHIGFDWEYALHCILRGHVATATQYFYL